MSAGFPQQMERSTRAAPELRASAQSVLNFPRASLYSASNAKYRGMQMRQKSFTAIIIGGNAAGLSAASKIKRLRPSARVLVFEKGPDVSYGNCGIPAMLEGRISHSDLLLHSAEALRRKRGLEVYPLHEGIAIRRKERAVVVRNLQTGRVFEEQYDRLLISTGAAPRLPDWLPATLENVFTLRSLEDGRRLQTALSRNSLRATVLGGGYLGIEIAAALRTRKAKVVLIEQAPRLLPSYHPAIAERVQAHLLQLGIGLHVGNPAVDFRPGGLNRIAAVRLASGLEIETDILVAATGARPNVQLAREADLPLGATGAIAVDEFLRTRDPDIFAAGDCIEVPHRLTGKKVWMPFGPAANRQGRIAGENMAGGRIAFPGVFGTSAFSVAGLQVARTGLGPAEAPARSETVVVQTRDLAAYIPGEKHATVVLTFRKLDGRLLGGQIAGYHGVAQRIDVLVAALHAGLTLKDLAQMDFGYHPEMAPVWDPLLVAANAGLKLLR